MRSSSLRIIHHARSRIRDEAESSRSLSFRILHDDHIDNLSPLLEVALQRLICGAVIKSSDEELACAFRLTNGLLKDGSH